MTNILLSLETSIRKIQAADVKVSEWELFIAKASVQQQRLDMLRKALTYCLLVEKSVWKNIRKDE